MQYKHLMQAADMKHVMPYPCTYLRVGASVEKADSKSADPCGRGVRPLPGTIDKLYKMNRLQRPKPLPERLLKSRKSLDSQSRNVAVLLVKIWKGAQTRREATMIPTIRLHHQSRS